MYGLRAALSWLWYSFSWLLKSLWGVVCLVKVAILWWWRIYKPHPIAAVMLLVIFTLPIAAVLRELSPHHHLVVAPFEVPTAPPGNMAVTGRTVSNLLADELRKIQSDAEFTDTLTVRLELGGLSLDSLFALWDGIRHQHDLITGDVIFGPEGLTLRARIADEEIKTFEVGPVRPNRKNLGTSVHELAAKILIEKNYSLGAKFDEKGEYDEAIRAYKKVLVLKPENAKIRYNLGLALQKVGRNEEAERKFSESIEAYKKTLRRNPKLAKTRFNLALALQKAQREPEARQEFREAQRLDPNLKPPMD